MERVQPNDFSDRLDDKREAFARNVAMGYNLTESARRAGYAEGGINNTGSRLAKDRSVAERIAKIRATTENNELASKNWVLCEVIDNHRLARKYKDINTSRQCLELIARLQGYLVERRDTQSVSFRFNLSDPAQLRSAIQQQLQDLPNDARGNLLELAPPELAQAIQAECEAVKEPEKE